MSEDREAQRRIEHARRAAVADTAALQRRLEEFETRQRLARWAVERELRREHFGHPPERLDDEQL